MLSPNRIEHGGDKEIGWGYSLVFLRRIDCHIEFAKVCAYPYVHVYTRYHANERKTILYEVQLNVLLPVDVVQSHLCFGFNSFWCVCTCVFMTLLLCDRKNTVPFRIDTLF